MKRFLKSILRSMRRNTLSSAINLSGLVLGFTCITIISVWIRNELSYDRFHKNSPSIYRVHRYFYDENGSENLHLPQVAPPVGPLLQKDFPEILYACRTVRTSLVFNLDDKKFAENNVCFVEPEVTRIFTFEGLPDNTALLMQPFTAIISDEIAEKYFPAQEAIGKNLEFKDDDGNTHLLQIQGVFRRWEKVSHFNPDVMISFSTLEALVGQEELQDWSSNNYETYALIPRLPEVMDQKLDNFIDQYLENGTKWTKIRLEALTDIHFNWYSNRSYVYILTGIALLILILGIINYSNLSTAIYAAQMKDIKLKRIIGATRKGIMIQLLTESVVFCLLSFLVALYVAYIFLPVLNKTLHLNIGLKFPEDLPLMAGLLMLAVFTGIIAGIYPLFELLSFRLAPSESPALIKRAGHSFRNGLVVFQFAVSIALIISFLLISKQLHFVMNKDLGLDKENIVVIPATPLLLEKLDVFKQRLSQNTNILGVAASKRVPSEGLWDSNNARIVSGGSYKPLGFRLANVRIDADFIPTYGIKILAGRNFNKNLSMDFGYIINELAVKKIGWNSPEEALEQVIEYGGWKGKVIGVVNDFHYESLHNPVTPIIMYNDPSDFNVVSIRLAPSERSKTLSFIEKTWQSYNNVDYIFTYEYLNDRYDNLYTPEKNTKAIFIYCMVIAMSIAMLGLIGLSLFLIEYRTKEIGIRKVNGAKLSQILVMLNRDFLKWVMIGFVIACPVAWYAMHKWLQSFAYKTGLSWWIFAAAGVLSLLVALITVSWQSWRAARKNPVEALRYE